MNHSEGAGKRDDIRLCFDRRVRLEFHGSWISSDGGLLFRELDDVFGLHDIAGGLLRDTRTGHNRLHSLVGLLRQSVFGRLAGYEDVNDAVHDRVGLKWITLDMDSSVSPTHGDQEGTAWNGHFGCKCYHPLFVFNPFGDLERCVLRRGNVHSADGWKEVLAPVIARYAQRDLMRFFRADAAFAIPDLYKLLESEGYFYAIRLKANRVLQGKVAHLLPGWPSPQLCSPPLS